MLSVVREPVDWTGIPNSRNTETMSSASSKVKFSRNKGKPIKIHGTVRRKNRMTPAERSAMFFDILSDVRHRRADGKTSTVFAMDLFARMEVDNRAHPLLGTDRKLEEDLSELGIVSVFVRDMRCIWECKGACNGHCGYLLYW